MAVVWYEESVGLVGLTVAFIGFTYGILLYFLGASSNWATLFLIGGGLLGFAFAVYLIAVYQIQEIVEV